MTFVNAGASGNTTVDMRARLDVDVLSYHPPVVFVLGGVNDLGILGASASEVEGQLSVIYSRCAAAGAKVVPCTLTPWPAASPAEQANLEELNSWIRAYGLPYVDFYAANPEIRPDGLHPDAAGNTTMANAIDLALIRAP